MGNWCECGVCCQECPAYPKYEVLCNIIENKLILHCLEIKQFETTLDEVTYTEQQTFDFSMLASIFDKYGVNKKEFLETNSPYLKFFSGITGILEDDKDYVLSSCLPYSKGSALEKREVMWRCLVVNNKNYVIYDELCELIQMLIIIPVKLIPEIVIQKFPEESEDPELKQLAECQEKQIIEYGQQYYPAQPKNTGYIHKHEFDNWLTPEMIWQLFSPSLHRERMLKFLAEIILKK